MNAAAVAAALSERAEEVCRAYLPHGRRQGRYWVAGDLDGARGRSLFVRLRGPGTPGKFTDAADGRTHGDLLDIVRHRSRAPTLRAALDEARAFLALPPAPDTSVRARRPCGAAPTTRPRRRGACGAVAARSTGRTRSITSAPAGFCNAASRRCASIPSCDTGKARPCAGSRRWSPPSPAMTRVTETERALLGVQRTWLDPRSPAKAGVAAPRKALGRVYGRAVRFGRPADGASLLVGEGIETVLSVVTAVPAVTAAAALSAGSLGAFAPPPGTTRLVIARDNDAEGERAAERLARRCARAGVAAIVVVSEGGDFNNDLVALGPDALAARLAPLFRLPGRARE